MLRSDNFSNYRSAAMRELLDHYNMEQQFIVPYCSWMIGKAEKLNHTLWSAATALLYAARLEPCFWWLAVAHANWLRNHLPHANGSTPMSRIHGNSNMDGSIIKSLHTFGDDAVAFRSGGNTGALNVKGRLGIWVGRSMGSAQLVYFPDTRHVHQVYHVKIFPGSPFRLKQFHSRPQPAPGYTPPLLSSDDADSLSPPTDTSVPNSHTPGDILEPSIMDDVASKEPVRAPPRRTGPGAHQPTIPRSPLPGQSTQIPLSDKVLRQREDNYLDGSVERQPAIPPENPTVHSPLPPAPINDDATRITSAIKHNTPCTFAGSKRAGSAARRRWDSYSTSVTLQDALDNGATRSDLQWDLVKGLLRLHDGHPETALSAVVTHDSSATTPAPLTHRFVGGISYSDATDDDTTETKNSDATDDDTTETKSNPKVEEGDSQSQDHKVDILNYDRTWSLLKVNVPLVATEAQYIAAAARLEPTDKSEHGLPITNNYEEAKRWQQQGINHGDKWVEAFQKEVEAFKTFNTFKAIPRSQVPKGKTILTGRFTGKIKSDSEGKPTIWKQRWVVRGYMERFGESFYQTNSDMLDHTSIFTMISLAAANRWKLKCIDLSNAYLHGEYDSEHTYVEMPRGFELKDDNGEDLIWRLIGNTYGLRAANRTFVLWRDKELLEMGFTRFSKDHSVFWKASGTSTAPEQKICFICFFVDDALVAFDDEDFFDQIYKEMSGRWTVKCEDAQKFLGMTITQGDDGSVQIDNRTTIDKMLKEFEWDTIGTTKDVPVPPGFEPDDETIPLDPSFPQHKFLGFISYLASTTRVDLKAPLNRLARYINKWNTACTKACKHMARYIKKTRDLGLRYHADDGLVNKAIGFSDYGSHSVDRSVGGYSIILNGASVRSNTWSIKGTKTSTGWGEAEALKEGVRALIATRDLLAEFMFPQTSMSNPLFCDSKAVISAVMGSKQSKRSEQYHREISYLKDQVNAGYIHMRYCETKHQCADILTKVKFPSILHFIGLRDIVMGKVKNNLKELEQNSRMSNELLSKSKVKEKPKTDGATAES